MNDIKLDDETLMLMQMIDEQDDCELDLTVPLSPPPAFLSKGLTTYKSKRGLKSYPTPIGTYGNFSFIQAPPKNCKTYFVSLMSSAYAGASDKYVSDIVSHRGDRMLLHFDTEQGKWHSKNTFMRLIDMLDLDYIPDFYKTFYLRKLSFKSKAMYIEYQLKKYKDLGKKIGLVIIDGIADLAPNNNDESYAVMVNEWLLRVTDEYDCHIMTVIHTNHGSEKPTGHLGSFLEKKAETQIHLSFNKNTGCIEVNCKRSRNSPFKDFSFAFDTSNLPIIV